MSKKAVPQALLDFINSGNTFLVAGHKEPDGDCISSQLVMASLLKRLGKKAILCSAGPFKRTEILPYKDLFVETPSEDDKVDARVFIMDCSNRERTGDLGPAIEGLPTALIDHHAGGNPYGDIVYLDPSAPSVTFMILSVFDALNQTPTKEEVELLFFGLCTDTGFFRHVDETGFETFECAARLIKAGANPKKSFLSMYGGKSLDSRLLMGKILSSAESFFDGRVIICTETYEENLRFGYESRDSDNIYQLLQSVAGVEAMMIIKQETSDLCTIGLRSRDTINVADIASFFGGGGHKNASGMLFSGTIEEAKAAILDELKKIM
ncbi:MAG: bifunctional oligoribonuclease/PAP phosphatase NrnA [Treponema sp.]|jgi:phosphoesterase RecJ-like protein|nr:bifunctional oligoribonuclease/PAP phosphatase NrnA [Treponema sp.]